MKLEAAEKPCRECPWRRDVAVGNFESGRFVDLAHTASDMARKIFQCHKTADERPLVCAGFLERGADHNLTVRLAYMRGELEKKERSAGLPLYDDYREMATANGVSPDDPCLLECRAPTDR